MFFKSGNFFYIVFTKPQAGLPHGQEKSGNHEKSRNIKKMDKSHEKSG